MLTELYIDALLANEELADQVWELWNDGLIPDDQAALAWWMVLTAALVAAFSLRSNCRALIASVE